jgi:hypothetical protein
MDMIPRLREKRKCFYLLFQKTSDLAFLLKKQVKQLSFWNRKPIHMRLRITKSR